jgi:3-oxoadipate enol-lactonase
LQYIRSGSEIIHFQDTGPRSDTAIVFINSLGTDLRVWDAVVKEIGHRYRVIRFDKRGHGLSTNLDNDISIPSLTNDLKLLTSELGIKKVSLVGLSIGGLIALEFLKTNIKLVKGLVLSDTASKIGNKEMWSERVRKIKSGGIASIADNILARWFSNEFLRYKAAELQLWRSMLTRTSVSGYIGCCEAIANCDLTEIARSVNIPTLVIVGEEDGSTPVNLVKETANLIKGSEFHVIKGAGHLPCVEKPKVFSDKLVKFLGSIS